MTAPRRDERRKRRIGDSAIAYRHMARGRDVEFINPYGYMSSTEARVHLALERYTIPFSWRYFDAWDQAPHLAELLPSYAPEFTLKEYRTVIVVSGGFFGSIPGILDRTALAQVLLEEDGWTFIMLYEADILRDVDGLLARELPWYRNPPIKGPPRMPPMGRPDFMSQRRADLSAYAIRRGKYALTEQQETTSGRNDTSGRRRKRSLRRRNRRGRNRDGS